MEAYKSFKYWRVAEIERNFGVNEVYEHPLLDEWLDYRVEVPDNDLEALKELRQITKKKVGYWNEAELKFFFISPIVQLINFVTSDTYNGFLEQTLSVKINDQTSSGNIDFMVAMGKREPVAPYFMLHEYKPESKARLDPQGQLLIAMVAGLQRNIEAKHEGPVYGTYVMGRFWFFVILTGKEFVISSAYDCTKEGDLQGIYHALAFVKTYVEKRANAIA